MNAEAFEVVDRTVQACDFDFTPVAGAGIHLANVQGTAQDFLDSPLELPADLLHGSRRREPQPEGACSRA